MWESFDPYITYNDIINNTNVYRMYVESSLSQAENIIHLLSKPAPCRPY